MTLQEAFNSCRQGNFVSHNSFDFKQSMHYYDGSFYYEDGVNLTPHLEWLESQEWAKDGWYVKYMAILVDINTLKQLHNYVRRSTTNINYEACITT